MKRAYRFSKMAISKSANGISPLVAPLPPGQSGHSLDDKSNDRALRCCALITHSPRSGCHRKCEKPVCDVLCSVSGSNVCGRSA